MPGRETHKYVGAAAGLALAAAQAQQESKPHFLIEMMGGALGGMVGGIAPDWLEPAVCSWHRGICHSAAAGGVLVCTQQTLANWAGICRQNAVKCRMVPQVEDIHSGEWLPTQPTSLQRLWSEICEFVWTLLAGFLNGLTAGYVSHLLLDAATPRGIPILAGRAALKL